MGAVIPIHSRRTFTAEAAEEILPVVRRITEQSSLRLRDITEQLRWVPREEALHARLKAEQDLIVRRWAVKISKLGCEPRGVWIVDFDAGDGWFSWRYGDESLNFFHAHGATDRPAIGAGERLPPAMN